MRKKRKHAGRSSAQLLFYYLLHYIARMVAIAFYRVRVFGRKNWPREGGALLCANHQGYLDPVLVGLCSERPLNILAKRSLFRFPLKTLIET